MLRWVAHVCNQCAAAIAQHAWLPAASYRCPGCYGMTRKTTTSSVTYATPEEAIARTLRENRMIGQPKLKVMLATRQDARPPRRFSIYLSNEEGSRTTVAYGASVGQAVARARNKLFGMAESARKLGCGRP